MKTVTIFALLLFSNLNLLLANNNLPIEIEIEPTGVKIHLNMRIIGSENVRAKVFNFDIVGLESDGSAKYLTNGITEDITSLITDLKMRKSFVKIGIKLKWGKQAKYFLFTRKELADGQIDMSKGR